MATEIHNGEGREGPKKGRATLPNPRIDMTPMVDLGFLLLTFFVLTTTMVTPKSMAVVMPEPNPHIELPLPVSKVLQLVIGQKNRIYYYQADDASAIEAKMQMTTFSKDGIRRVIADKRRAINKQWQSAADPHPMIVLIKLADNANYKNFVDILDEMAIMDVKRFATLDISQAEVEMVGAYDRAAGLQ